MGKMLPSEENQSEFGIFLYLRKDISSVYLQSMAHWVLLFPVCQGRKRSHSKKLSPPQKSRLPLLPHYSCQTLYQARTWRNKKKKTKSSDGRRSLEEALVYEVLKRGTKTNASARCFNSDRSMDQTLLFRYLLGEKTTTTLVQSQGSPRRLGGETANQSGSERAILLTNWQWTCGDKWMLQFLLCPR